MKDHRVAYRISWRFLNLLIVEFFVEYFQSQQIVKNRFHVADVDVGAKAVFHQRQDAILIITHKLTLSHAAVIVDNRYHHI